MLETDKMSPKTWVNGEDDGVFEVKLMGSSRQVVFCRGEESAEAA